MFFVEVYTYLFTEIILKKIKLYLEGDLKEKSSLLIDHIFVVFLILKWFLKMYKATFYIYMNYKYSQISLFRSACVVSPKV